MGERASKALRVKGDDRMRHTTETQLHGESGEQVCRAEGKGVREDGTVLSDS